MDPEAPVPGPAEAAAAPSSTGATQEADRANGSPDEIASGRLELILREGLDAMRRGRSLMKQVEGCISRIEAVTA